MSALSVSVMTCSCLEDRPTLSGDVVGNVSATAASEMKRPSKRAGSASFSFIYVSLRNLHCCPRLACHGRTPKQRSIAVEFSLEVEPISLNNINENGPPSSIVSELGEIDHPSGCRICVGK